MKMKATKSLALFLAALMVLSSMVFVATAEKITYGSEQHLVVYKFTSTKETENAYYDDSLRVGSAQTNTGSSVDWAGRYADGGRYFGYAFPITGDTMPTGIEFRARVRGDLLVQVSVDKTAWVTAYSAPSRLNPTVMDIDLTAAFNTALAGGTAKTLYVRFGDNVSSDGYGANILSSQAARLVMDYSKDATSSGKTYSYSFTTSGVVEKKYLDSSIGTANVDYNIDTKPNFGRFADGARFFGYAIPLKAGIIPEKVTFSGEISGDYLLQVSLDKASWTTASVRDPDKVDIYTPVKYTFDLTEAYLDAWDESKSYDYLYVRIGDNTSNDGYGGCLRASSEASVSVKYADDAEIYTPNVDIRAFKPGSANETAYLHALLHGNGNLNASGSVRYADKNAHFIYAYELYTTEMPGELTWSASTSNQLYLQISADSYHWVDVYKYDGGINADGSGGLPTQLREYDLLDAYKKALELAGDSTMLYVKISDSYPASGWGGAVSTNTDVTLRIEYAPTLEGLAMNDYYSTINATASDKYYLTGGNVSGTSRYADCNAKVVFQYPFTGAATSERILLTMAPTAQFHLEVSVDNANWVTAFRYNDLGLMVKNASASAQSAYQFARKERTFDLTAAVSKAAALSAENGTLDSGLYIRYGDSHPTRVDATGAYTGATSGAGWGGSVTGSVKLSVAKSSDFGVVANTDNVIIEKVAQAANGNYYFCENEPMLVTDDGFKQGSMGTNISASRVTTLPDGTKVSTGDGNYYGRASDNSYFVYRYSIPTTAKAMIWSAKLGGAYGVSVAVTGRTCPDPYDQYAWETVALYSEDGLNGTNENISKSISYDLSDYDVSGGDLYLYIKIADANWDVSGWGGRIALGSENPIKMAWEVSVDDEVKTVGMKGAWLNLTENLSMIFNPRIPMSSTDPVVTIGFEGEEMVTVEPSANGTYCFSGIRPQRMTDTIVFRVEGTIGESETYEYEMTYSVRQYCENMLAAYPEDEELTTLIKDILAYGAAAQKHEGYKTDDLADANITARSLDNINMNGVFNQVIFGEDNIGVSWDAFSLMMDSPTKLILSFYTENIEGVKMVIVNEKGEETVYGEDNFEPFGVEGVWQISYDVKPYEFADGYTAYFERDGVRSDCYIVYSINTFLHYFVPVVDSDTEIACRLYYYGESVLNYIYSR